MEQQTALVAEAKTVLDSWVRYEGQVKIRQQKELSESVIAKIQKELENPKVLQQILQQSVADVESKCFVYMIKKLLLTILQRLCLPRHSRRWLVMVVGCKGFSHL